MSAAEVLKNLEELKRRVHEMGWEIREEWLNGKGCAVCELRGTKVLFVDISVEPWERWRQLSELVSAEMRQVARNVA